MRNPRRLALTLVPLLAACAVGCAGNGAGGTNGGTGERTLTVLAASSLEPVLPALARHFEAQRPGLEVEVSFAGSTTLVRQVLAGAAADILISADEVTMRPVLDAGLAAGPPRIVARNRLAIAAPADNPGAVEALADLADPDLLVAVCAPEVPCGRAARVAFERAGVEVSADTHARSVRAVLTKVVLGEVDAGVVYATDVRSAGDRVVGIPLPPAAAVTVAYPAAILDNPGDAHPLADGFVALLLGPTGRDRLVAAGFTLP